MGSAIRVLTVGLFAIVLSASTGRADTHVKCLFISSYHKGYAWSDGVERGLRRTLEPHCEFRQFDMDTKRRKSEAEKRERARAAKSLIDEWRPDIVVTADDNAAKYLIVPYFRDTGPPIVFTGVNWTAEEYGFPYSNVTGMIEVAPIGPLIMRARHIVPDAATAFYIGADTLTERKNLARFEKAARDAGLRLSSALVPDGDAWLEVYERAQSADFVILGSNAGIVDWDADRIATAVEGATQRLSVTNHGWMMRFATLGIVKVPEEQGEWAGLVAREIFAGTRPDAIPIVANRRVEVWVNEVLADNAGVSVPTDVMRKAKKVPRDGGG